ncbi:hypothetical protein TNIN_375171 [Trichonephila inaurata madagascariensis]|uniref:Uncharacterized protein n=1 Tax=Trichonephila inaurata madagascariensis TaxID=2747483 RepID=A0A8X7CAS8_9ARAC|nr:hypothetical protein TNIN_375171 [Trichonephila inaurata madagascariensis]
MKDFLCVTLRKTASSIHESNPSQEGYYANCAASCNEISKAPSKNSGHEKDLGKTFLEVYRIDSYRTGEWEIRKELVISDSRNTQ